MGRIELLHSEEIQFEFSPTMAMNMWPWTGLNSMALSLPSIEWLRLISLTDNSPSHHFSLHSDILICQTLYTFVSVSGKSSNVDTITNIIFDTRKTRLREALFKARERQAFLSLSQLRLQSKRKKRTVHASFPGGRNSLLEQIPGRVFSI